MAKDKKVNPNKEQKVEPKDKDLHLSVIGVSPKNVNVKKTQPRQNNEEYQLFRISIDTKGKHNDRKRRLSTLQTSPKKATDRKRYESKDNGTVSSDDSQTDLLRPQRNRRPGGHKGTKRKPDVDDDICFTIPGEKGKAIRLVGGPAKTRDESSSHPPKINKTKTPRQVDFARTDEVYGSSANDSSLDSRGSMEYKKASPQIYNVEMDSPTSVFKDPKKSKHIPEKVAIGDNDEKLGNFLPPGRAPYPSNLPEDQSKPSLHISKTSCPLSNRSKQEQDRYQEIRVPRTESQRAVPRMPTYYEPSTTKHAGGKLTEASPSQQSAPSRFRPVEKGEYETSAPSPSTSNVSSKYEPTSGYSTETKGKYPFYPYDKQKRSKSPTKQSQEEDRESYMYQKLPSIPEVRSAENVSPTHTTGVHGLSPPPKEFIVIPMPTTKSINDSENVPSNKPYIQVPNVSAKTNPIKKQTNVSSNPSDPALLNVKRDSAENRPMISNIPQSSQIQYSHSTTPNTQRDYPVIYGTPKVNRPQTPVKYVAQTTPPITPDGKRRGGIPTTNNYKTQTKPDQLKTPNTNHYGEQSKPQEHTPVLKLRDSPQKDSGNTKLSSKNIQVPSVKKDQVTEKNKTPARPTSADKQIMTDKHLHTKGKTLLDPNDKISNKSSPSLQKKADKLKNPIVEKDQVSKNPPVNGERPAGLPFTTQIMPNWSSTAKEKISKEINEELSKKSSPLSQRNSKASRKTSFKKNQEPVDKIAPTTGEQPLHFDLQAIPEKSMTPKDKMLLETNERVINKSSPLNPLQGSSKDNVPASEKPPKRKSKLSSFVSSIPKPLFRRKSSLEKKRTDKSIIADNIHPKLSSLEENPNVIDGIVDIKDDKRSPVEESAIIKVAHEPVIEAYPSWVSSPNQETPGNRKSDDQSPPFKHEPLSGATEQKNSSNQHLPIGTTSSSSVELANRSYGTHSVSRRVSTAPTVVSEQVQRLLAAGEEELLPNYPRGQDDAKRDIDDQSRKPPYEEKGKHREDSAESTLDDSGPEHGLDYNNDDRRKTPYQGPNVIAYPGQVRGQTPFGYDSQFPDLKENNQVSKSSKDAFGANERRKKENDDSIAHPDVRKYSLTSRSDRSPRENLVTESLEDAFEANSSQNKDFVPHSVDRNSTSQGRPIHISVGSADWKLFLDERSPGEVSSNPNKKPRAEDGAFVQGKRTDDASQVSEGSARRSPHTPIGLVEGEVSARPLDESPFGKTPQEQMVFIGNVPNQTHNVFRPDGSNSEGSSYKGQSNPLSTERMGPKGILIFVNKKNEAGSPFEKGSPEYSTKSTNQNGTKKGGKETSKSPGGNSAQSSVHASGDSKVTAERSPSGTKTTVKYPCGCIRIMTTDPKNQLKKEELITGFCKDGSRCEVSKRRGAGKRRSTDSSSLSWEGSRPDRLCPDVDVLVDGIVSRRPIKPRPPAPTMNGAKLTGSFKIKSNKVNGVCNFYLDRKLKTYLRNNMEKIQLLLEDEDRR